VSDYRRSTAFYRDLMGWEIRNDNGNNQATLKIGDLGGIIIRNRREPAATQSAARRPRERQRQRQRQWECPGRAGGCVRRSPASSITSRGRSAGHREGEG
jgi:catechol 2,3-dioxygenase-like lactoylglutathione lyase family enzyme